MEYAYIENGAVKFKRNIPKNWKNISGFHHYAGNNVFLKTLGWLPVITNTITILTNEVRDEDVITINDNDVTVDEKKRTMTDYEIADRLAGQWESLRFERNELLTETDWMAASDRTMSDAEAVYRQTLRDLPANTDDPSNPIWPTKPGA
jgi:hypothetical protein|tara:strand:- start:839 stop:1285 length:447 start_codon:yes stop_codon:yes gene_type:complete